MDAEKIERAFSEIDQRLAKLDHEGTGAIAALRKGLNDLRSLVVRHYADVHKLLKSYEKRIERAEKKLGLPHSIKPEKPPKPLRDPP